MSRTEALARGASPFFWVGIGALPLRKRDVSFSGYIKRAEVLSTGELFYEAVTSGFEVPFVGARSLDAKPLLASGAAEFRFSDPYGNFGQESIRFLIKGKPCEAILGEPLTVQIP
ncbi:MAG: hypothetical protein SVK44_07540 [Nitrospirota bacterium]|nr:hypothetical protein [Nitrospirota bacterium]